MRRRWMLNCCSFQKSLLWLSSLTPPSFRHFSITGFRFPKPIVWYHASSFSILLLLLFFKSIYCYCYRYILHLDLIVYLFIHSINGTVTVGY